VIAKAHDKLPASLVKACSSTLRSLKYEFYSQGLEAIANSRRLTHLEFKFRFWVKPEYWKAILSLQNLKVLRGIRYMDDWDYNALFDSCGQSLEELSINEDIYFIPAAFMRENLSLRHLKILGKERISAE
jgi:hypothetical protein